MANDPTAPRVYSPDFIRKLLAVIWGAYQALRIGS
jgi:hypothetical protein